MAQERPTFSRVVVGFVKDRENRPVAGAKVCAQPTGGMGERIPCGISKADGGFQINIQRPTTYTILAEKLAAGYPDATNAFYGSFFGELPVIEVTESNELKPVEVIVGPKAGRIIFKIVNAKTGQLIQSGLVKVCRVNNPHSCWSMGTPFPHGRHELLAPEVAFTINFGISSGRKWKKWFAFDEKGRPVELLQIDLGVQKEITIRLSRVQQQPIAPRP